MVVRLYNQQSSQDDQHEFGLLFAGMKFVATVVLFAPELTLLFVDDPVVNVVVSSSPNPEAMRSPIPLNATSLSRASNTTPRCVRFIAVISDFPLALGESEGAERR
jgi:hypothetical protein